MNRRQGIYFSVAFVVAAAVLRLIWVGDMEYKYDEYYMFSVTQMAGATDSWPMIGMESGASLRNPALSVWLFIVLKNLFSVTTPIGLTRAVMILNVLAVALVFLFAFRFVNDEEREGWLWAGALAAVNPAAIQLHRKIWAQSLLPLFSMLMIAGWWSRRRPWGAFLWGFLGACVGQIHMTGFFFSGALLLWTLVFDRFGERERRTWRTAADWKWWLIGSAVGATFLVSWILYVLNDAGARVAGMGNQSVLGLYFWRHWIVETLGVQAQYNIGPALFEDFLRSPVLFGAQTYVVGAAYLLIGLLALKTALGVARAMWERRATLTSLWIGRDSQSAFLSSMAFWGFGILLTASAIVIYRHYIVVAFPLTYLWLARAVLVDKYWGRRTLAVMVLAQACLGIAFLVFIHVHHGAAGGDYGVSYQWQRY